MEWFLFSIGGIMNKKIFEISKNNYVPYDFSSNFNTAGVWTPSQLYYSNNGGMTPLAVIVGSYAQARNWGQPNGCLQGLWKNLPMMRPVLHQGYFNSYSSNETYCNSFSINLFCDHTATTYTTNLFRARSTKGIAICIDFSSYAIYGSTVSLSVYQDNVLLSNTALPNIGLDCYPKFRWKILGNILYLKYWITGGAEPASYQLEIPINVSALTYKDIEVMAGLTAYSDTNPQHTQNIYELTISNK